jgi:hypothetical protein
LTPYQSRRLYPCQQHHLQPKRLEASFTDISIATISPAAICEATICCTVISTTAKGSEPRRMGPVLEVQAALPSENVLPWLVL